MRHPLESLRSSRIMEQQLRMEATFHFTGSCFMHCRSSNTFSQKEAISVGFTWTPPNTKAIIFGAVCSDCWQARLMATSATSAERLVHRRGPVHPSHAAGWLQGSYLIQKYRTVAQEPSPSLLFLSIYLVRATYVRELLANSFTIPKKPACLHHACAFKGVNRQAGCTLLLVL